ncbi:MAG TPA: CocE/NonD family hydrolase [Chitinophagaceae bacterium]|nr:CocE/NonD family hydrolase [Chitinophagaceae bacterium]
MLRSIFPILALLFLIPGIARTQASQVFKGDWEGVINISGTSLRIVFHITDNGQGGLVSTADSPDQSAFGIPCDSTSVNNQEILISMNALQASFSGKLVNDTTIDGEFRQGHAGFPVQLKKSTVTTEKPVARERPQNPKAPFPYRSEDVFYDSKTAGVKLAATITIPEGKGPFPSILLISGSGPQNRDEELLGHKPFAVLADYLTRKGYIVLRVDDRGIGKSTGDFATATSADFASDANGGIDYLLTRPEVNKKKIGIMGHSEGGMIAPMIAASRKDIDFIVMMAGPGVKIIEMMAAQNAAVLRSAGISDAASTAYTDFYREVVKTILSSPDTAAAIESGRKVLQNWVSKTPDSLVAQLGISHANVQEQMISSMVQQISTPWFRYFFNHDPQPNLQKLRCKVLAINGSRDVQVVSQQNLSGIEQAFKKSKLKTYEIKELPGLNHLFQTCNKCTLQEYEELEETFSPVALDFIGNWLDKNVK